MHYSGVYIKRDESKAKQTIIYHDKVYVLRTAWPFLCFKHFSLCIHKKCFKVKMRQKC